ncbi:hypothetical protein QTP88_010458 [Uroleucon formosanum]
MGTYSLVHFIGDDSVEPVLSTWFIKNRTCAWPKNRALIKKFRQLKTIPNEIEFDYHEARILKTNIRSFEEANHLAEKGCNQNSDDEKCNKSNKSDHKSKYADLKIQKPSIIRQLSYDTSPNLINKYKNVSTFNLNHDNKNSNEDIIENQLESSDVHLDEKSSKECISTPKLLDISTEAVNSSTLDYQKETLHMLTFIKHELRRIHSYFNIYLHIFWVNELSYIGGKNIKSMVKRLMAKLFKDELLKNFSYTGKKGKQKFSNLATCSVIFDAIKTQGKFKHSTQNEMEDIIKFAVLGKPINLQPTKVNTIVLACCYLHNFLKRHSIGYVNNQHVTSQSSQGIGLDGHVFGMRSSSSSASSTTAKVHRDTFCSYFNNEGKVEWQDKI